MPLHTRRSRHEIEQAKRSLTGGDGFDYAIECVGSDKVIRRAFEVVASRQAMRCVIELACASA